jgi:hypothetical protein
VSVRKVLNKLRRVVCKHARSRKRGEPRAPRPDREPDRALLQVGFHFVEVHQHRPSADTERIAMARLMNVEH